MKRKTTTVIFALLMLAAIFLSSCATSTPQVIEKLVTQVVKETVKETVVVEVEKVITATPEATEEVLPFYQIRWLIRAVPQPDTPRVQAAVNQYLDENYPDLNFHVTLDIIGRGEYNDKISLINAAGELYDMGFTASWTNNFWANVQQGYLYPLDDLLSKYGQGVVESMPEGSLEAARVSGSIYAIPCQTVWVQPFGASVTQDALDHTGTEDMFYNIENFDDLTEWMQALYDGMQDDPNFEALFPLPQYTNQYGICEPINWGYDSLFGHDIVAKLDDPEVTLVVWPETAEFKQCVEMTRDWAERGFYLPEALLADENIASLRDGRTVGGGCCGDTAPSLLAGWENQIQREWVATPLIYRSLQGAELVRNMIFISATSGDPERTMMWIDLLHTDVQLYNMVAYGLEGVHWVWKDKEKNLVTFPPGVDSSTTGYFPGVPYIMGNMLDAFYWSDVSAEADEYGVALEQNASAPVAYSMGFSFDLGPVEAELTAISAIKGEYAAAISSGQYEDTDAAIAEYVAALKDAGIDKVLAEYRKQLDAWKASR